MAIEEKDTTVAHYKMAKFGVNLNKNILELVPEEAVNTQNCVWKNGMVKRGGQTLIDTDQVVDDKKIVGLHRFYKKDGTKQTIATAGTITKYLDAGTWTNVKTGLTDSTQTFMTTIGWDDSVYGANGTDAPWRWTGSAVSTISNAPADTLQFLQYRDRVLSITGGDLTWSGSFTIASWLSVANANVRPDTKLNGMVYHSSNDSKTGIDTKILLAGDNGMYLFFGTDLDFSGTPDYVLAPLAYSVGCNAPRTMIWTPLGTMWLGIDRQVYMLPFASATPIPVGNKITSVIRGEEGIEKIPAAQLANACAVYHDGFYKLSVARDGQTTNNAQWWLDVTRMHKDENAHHGPWFGPMLGQTINVFAKQAGAGDVGELLAGESSAKGYVYEVGDDNTFSDIDPSDASAKAIQVFYQTFYNDLTGNPHLAKDIHFIEAELLDVLGTVNIDFEDITGTIKSGDSFGLSGNAIFWDDAFWGEEDWSNSAPTRQKVEIDPVIQTRRLSILVKHNSSVDRFELYGISAEVKEQSDIYAVTM